MALLSCCLRLALRTCVHWYLVGHKRLVAVISQREQIYSKVQLSWGWKEQNVKGKRKIAYFIFLSTSAVRIWGSPVEELRCDVWGQMGMFDVTAIHVVSRGRGRHREPVQQAAPSHWNKYGQQETWQSRQGKWQRGKLQVSILKEMTAMRNWAIGLKKSKRALVTWHI